MHHCTKHNHRTVSMQRCACYQQPSVQPILVMSTELQLR